MKKEDRETILRAMPVIIRDLFVDDLFLSHFEEQKILDHESVDKILVNGK